MSTATKVVKSIYSKLVKEQQAQSDERSNDWRQLVRETVESKESPTDEVIQFLASEMGMDKDSSVELFRQDVETVQRYNNAQKFHRMHDKELKDWLKDLDYEEAKSQAEAMQKELNALQKKILRHQRLLEIIGTEKTRITNLIRGNRRLFDRPDKSSGWIDVLKLPAKYKA